MKTATISFGLFPIAVPYADDARALAVDDSSNIYVVSQNHATVTKYDWMGRWVREWGSSGTDPGQFQAPMDVETDARGNVYVADRNNFRIQKFDGDGHLLTWWGSQGDGPGQFQYLGALGSAPDGRLYVGQAAETAGGLCIQVFDRSVGVQPFSWGALRAKFR